MCTKLLRNVSKCLVLIFAWRSSHWPEQLFLSRNLNIFTFQTILYIFYPNNNTIRTNCRVSKNGTITARFIRDQILLFVTTQTQQQHNLNSTSTEVGFDTKMTLQNPTHPHPTPTHSQKLDRSLQESPGEHLSSFHQNLPIKVYFLREFLEYFQTLFPLNSIWKALFKLSTSKPLFILCTSLYISKRKSKNFYSIVC